VVHARPDQFDGLWAQYMQELKTIGMDEANAQMTKLVRDRVRLWEE
jgi:putative aldouronate transport system substrate-binding protein